MLGVCGGAVKVLHGWCNALRFDRKLDAEMYLSTVAFAFEGMGFRVVEHGMVGGGC